MKHKSSCFWKERRVLVLLVAVLLVLPMAAATKKKSTKHAPLTHNYKEAPLSAVFADIAKKCDYELVYDPADVDLDKRITMRFKDASAKSVLKKVLDKDLEYKVKKGKIFISRKPVPPTEYKVSATIPTQVDEDSTKIVSIYTDTLYSISCRTVTKEVKNTTPVKPSDKGHYVQAMVGGGYCGATLQAQYAYFFHENWGVYGGVGFSGTASFQRAKNKTFDGVLDSDGERYDHTVEVHNWKDRYTTYTVDIPLGVQFQYRLSDKLGLYAGLGAKIGFPVMNVWRSVGGEAVHNGYYAYSTHAHIAGGDFEDRDFYTLLAKETEFGKTAQKYKTPAVAAMVTADFGFAFPVSKQVDLLTGVYAQITCNDQRTVKDASMGWSASEGKYSHPFMAYPAQGIASTEQGKALLPYQVGVKVGIRWHHNPKPKTVPAYERIEKCDTTFSLVERRDTLVKPVQPAARELQRLMRKSVIWFDVNSTVPKLQPADILDRVAAVLIENPNQHVIVSGHASSEGNARKNRILSEKRAQVVADMLIEKGVPASQLKVEAHSSDVQYQTEDGEMHSISLDRRTEIIPE